MALYLKFYDIENDEDRKKAKALFYEHRKECKDNMQLVELRHDIIKGFIKPHLYNYD